MRDAPKVVKGRILFHAWRKAEMMNPEGMRERAKKRCIQGGNVLMPCYSLQ
jgi:hypothetical protein